VKDSTGKRK